MAISDRLNKLTTDITNAYTSIENKGGTMPANKNTNNLPTAINSIEVIEQATAEGESLNLTNTKAMPYSDYVVKGKSTQSGEPSPSNPSEIHSVADDVNLFDVITATANQSNYVLNSNETITNNKSYGNDGRTFFNNILLNAGTYTISYIPNLSGTTKNIRFSIKNIDSSTDIINQSISITNETKQTFSFTLSSDTNIAICIMANGANDGIITLKNIKLQKGTVVTPYSPYNQGTVTIKQETVKNYLDWNKFIDYSNWSNAESDGYKSFEISGLDTNKIYTLYRVDTAGYGEELKYAGFSKYKDNGNMFLHSTDNSQNLKNISSFTTQDGKIYINMFMNSQNDLNDYIAIIKKCWVIEETDYEPYQSNDYTIQTEPLRSLPNGVKDTIEADGIHRRVGSQILTDIEYLSSTTVFGVETKFGAYGLIGVKDENRNYNFMSDKIAPANENFLKYGAYRNQEALIVMTSSDDTLENFNSKISGSEVLYELAEEIIEPLTQNQATTMLDIIKTGSYKGTTNIYTDEDVKPTMKVEYYKKS